MLDEVERKRAYNALRILVDAIDEPTIQNAFRALQHIVMSLEQQIEELQGEEDE